MEINTYSPSKFLNKVSKRNRFYLSSNTPLNDDQPDETTPNTKRKASVDEKKISTLNNRLKTILKLPKAHRWVIYEWFYSNLDQPLFCCNKPNDFQLCLNDIFPHLKTRNVRRTEWCQIRKLMGKPRRCSAAFLEEERETLRRKREKIREIHLNSSIDNLNEYQELPDVVNLPMIIGSKCTVLYKKTHDGLFDGTINAIDLKNGTYRVSFDKPGFGYENVLDYEFRSVEPAESMPLVAFESKKNRPIGSSNTSSNVKKLYNQQKLNELIDDQQQYQLSYTTIKEENENSNELSNEMSSIASVNSDESIVRFMNHCSLNSHNSANSLTYVNTNNNSSSLLHNSTATPFASIFDSSTINSALNSTTLNHFSMNLTTNSNLHSPINSTINSSLNSPATFHPFIFNPPAGQLSSIENNEKVIGNYPLKFLACIISFYKLINKKSAKLNQLKTMNTPAEFYKSSAKSDKLSNEFRNEYATIILELEKIKNNLNTNLEHLEQHCKKLKLSPKQQNKNLLEQEVIRRNLVNRRIDAKSTSLIANLIGLLLVLKNADTDDLNGLQVKIKSIKQSLNHRNNQAFEDNVELHFNHLQFNCNLDKMTTNSRLDAFHNDHL